jgi:hypothetical protein
MSEAKRLQVRVEHRFISEPLLTELALACEEMEKKGVTPTMLEVQDSYEDTRYITLIGFRPETDEEIERRLRREESQREASAGYERETYERLKQKFGGK